jgi:hypothetical protein
MDIAPLSRRRALPARFWKTEKTAHPLAGHAPGDVEKR